MRDVVLDALVATSVRRGGELDRGSRACPLLSEGRARLRASLAPPLSSAQCRARSGRGAPPNPNDELRHTCLRAASSAAATIASPAPPAETRSSASAPNTSSTGVQTRGASEQPDAVSAIAVTDGGHRRSRRAVGPLERRLEPGAQAVVAETEEAHLVDVRVTGGPADEIAVDRGLGQLVRDGDVLLPLVAEHREVSTCQPTSSRWSLSPLSVVGCALPSNASQSASLTRSRFTKPALGQPVPPIEGVGGSIRIRMEAERVHQRPGAATRAVPGAECTHEAHG